MKIRNEVEELMVRVVAGFRQNISFFLRPHKGDNTRAWDLLCKRLGYNVFCKSTINKPLKDFKGEYSRLSHQSIRYAIHFINSE